MSNKQTRVITIWNQKGGVSKTTTAVSVSEIMAEVYHKNVLLIDFDSQGSASLFCNFPIWREDIPNIGHLISYFAVDGKVANIDEILSCVHRGKYTKNERKGMSWTEKEYEYPFDILPVCGTELSIGELAIHNPNNFIYKNPQMSFLMLKIIVDTIVKECNYDYIFIDSNPSLSSFAINGLMASDFLIVPTTMTVEAISGINGVLNRLKELQLYIPFFDVLGVLYSKYDEKRALDKDILAGTDFKAFETKIPDVSSKVSKSINEGLLPSMRKDKQYISFRQSFIDLCVEIEQRIEAYEKVNGPIQRRDVFGNGN